MSRHEGVDRELQIVLILLSVINGAFWTLIFVGTAFGVIGVCNDDPLTWAHGAVLLLVGDVGTQLTQRLKEHIS